MPRMDLGLPYNHCSNTPCRDGFQSPSLLRCGGCQVVKYCGQPHQKAHRPRHKVQCIPIKQQKDKVVEEEQKLWADPGVDTAGENPFESIVGNFWFFKSTLPYMQARFDHITAILNRHNCEAAEMALDNSLDLLHLCRGDNLSVRSQDPALYLRLSRDQEAYDFINWYAVRDPSYDFHDTSLPFLEKHDEDAFEAVNEKPNFTNLSFFVALTLIKIRLMKDLEGLQKFVQSKSNAAGEARYDYLQEEAMSDILLKRPDIVAQDNYKEIIDELRRQVLQLYKMAKEKNLHF
ncbi:hypothetical protein FOZG_18351 [Fusarium oxysporum Fo47]|uniref:MYND-type domain-containing protein n=1 Tax=Fusarium oxysporum Fo47 TaxID=660027 RepID=W9JE15_FUSOX|nr:hypothetical protein FOZG_18351 [Fusarium oxysporum Fo47]